MKLRWTRPALADVSQILDYITERNSLAAPGVAEVLESSVLRLLDHPNSGRPGRVAGTRELVIPKLPYVIAYRVIGDCVDILAVRHSARLWPERFR